MYESIPQELKNLPNWICWKAVPKPRPDDPEHIDKIPINPRTGGKAQSNNPDTWTDFDTALKASEQHSGIGFMFGNSPFFGVDVDKAEPDIREFLDGGNGIVSEFIHALRSYAELSPSGKGIHILCRGELPKGARHRGNVEMYDSGRFFTVTGNNIGEYTAVEDCTEAIKPLHEKYLGGARSEPAQRIIQTAPLPCSVSEVLEAASRAKNGSRFQALYAGNFSEYSSQSEADMAFCNMLAFWTGRNAALMDEIFRNSGLMRDKWDRRQSGSTYGALTIRKACEQCENVYQPPVKFRVKIGSRAGESGAAEPLEPKLYTFDDMGNAERFLDLFGEDFRYNYTDKTFLYWDGCRWAADQTGAVERSADVSVEAMSAEAEWYEKNGDEDAAKAFRKHIKASRSNKSKTNMLKEVQHNMPIMPFQLDKHKMAFNVPNGTLSLKSGQLVPAKRDYFITKFSPVEFTDNADCPMWRRFLDDIFGGDKELIRYIQKAVGYSMTGDTSEQCVFFLYGTGRNGKSTFLDVLREIFGDYVSNIQPETIMVKNSMGNGINSDIARLKGARMVTTVEPNEGVRLNEGLIKQLTGDDAVTARKLYGNEFEFKPEFKLWMATNHKPIIRGTDDGIWRRIHMIPFTVQIPADKVDRQLKSKLEREYPAILRWAVEGCLLWQREGLKQPRAVLDMTREYRREMDVISGFLDDRCEMGEGFSAKSSELYAAYSAWCESNTEFKMSNTKFSVEMDKRFGKTKQRDGMYFSGVRLYR
jgi:putative DNA primase/helicase